MSFANSDNQRQQLSIIEYGLKEPFVFGSNPPDIALPGILYIFNAAKSNSPNTYNMDGTPRPNVAAGDAFKFINLMWIWQFHFGSAVITGLTQVHHDDSLIGTGKNADNLLKVANPVTAAQISHIDQLYPRLISQVGTYEAGGTAANPSLFSPRGAGNQQVQTAGSFKRITHLLINRYSAVENSDISVSTQLSEVDWKVLYDKVVAGGEVTVIRLEIQGAGMRAASYKVVSATESNGHYTFTLGDAFAITGTMPEGSGQNYNITVGFNRKNVYAFQINNMDSVSELDRQLIRHFATVNSDGMLHISSIDEVTALIQGDNETAELTEKFRTDASNVSRYITVTPNASPNENTGICIITIPETDTANDADLQRLVQPGAWVRIDGWVINITSNYSRSSAVGAVSFSFNYEVEYGTQPTGSTLRSVFVVGKDVHRGELLRYIFELERVTLAGNGSSVTRIQVWTNESDDNDKWQDYANPKDLLPFESAFAKKYNRVIVSNVSTNGQGINSTDNTKPATAPDGTTAFFAMHRNTASGTDQKAELDKVHVGAWMRVDAGNGDYIDTEIQYIDWDAQNDIIEFWYIPSEAHEKTLRYGELPLGSATITIIRETLITDLVHGTPTQGDAPLWNTTNNRAEWGAP